MNIQEYLQQLLDLLLFDNYEIELAQDNQTVSIKIILPEEDSGILIGRHGETLTALRRLIRTVFLEEIQDRRIVINVNDYRDQREEKIRALIEKGIARIQATGDVYRLYRLNPAERFFVHNLVSSEPAYQGFTSYSLDDEDGQRVLVIAAGENR